jgi:transposase
MGLPVVGVDVSKAFLDVAVLDGERVRHHRAGNDPAGHAAIAAWLAERGADPAHICLEATGAYGFEFACAMVAAGHRVSLVNPAQIKAFGRSELLRTKTDRVDAALIARFCRAMNPRPWTPPGPAVLALRGLVRRCAALKQIRTQEINRAKAGSTSPIAAASVERAIAFFDGEIAAISKEIARQIQSDVELARQNALLRSIPGIGERAAAILLGELPDLRDFDSAKQLAAFVGIAPGENSSGARQATSGQISRVGNPTVRSTMVLCALAARRYNPIARSFAERLAAKGKPAKVVLVAVAKKLLVQAHAVLKHGTPFRADIQHTD